MKKITILGAIMISSLSFSQIDFGVKGGVNFASVGDLKSYTNGVFNGKSNSSDTETGFHVGAWGRVALPLIGFYVQPELNYTHLKSEFDGNKDYTLNKLDVPLLAGKKILGVGRIFVGPSFQFLLDDNLDGSEKDISSDDFTVGIQFGGGVQLGKLGLDVRYDVGLNNTTSSFVQIENGIENEIQVDTRPSQLILGLSYRITR